ncbi:GNAT family N-acetyltransferase [Oricola thermophila]|uniref:GNAT family N-acetyltransferase n=1 Tax=Oricola thermophila TaxID=2742145 RepID=A0A6N1VI57_9HYPH|nr:GNAT family N-acetyltransferase [Oricola thermophila]QKV19405.1 GNAT family N-acetyltransferase [Oricola thermophila]
MLSVRKGRGAAMRVELIDGRKAIAALRPHWNAVYEADPEATYFLSYEWQFGTPEGAGRFGYVLAVREPGSGPGYVAFLPLRRVTKHAETGFYNEIYLSGCYSSDYAGLICRPDHEEEALSALGAAVQRMNWRHFRLLNFAASGRRAAIFLRQFSGSSFEIGRPDPVNPDGIDNSVCPYAALPGDWDEFLATSVSANTRQKIRRFLRQVEGSQEFRITHSGRETLNRDIAILLKMWADKWGARKGRRLGTILETYRRLLHHAFETGTLFMPVFWHGDRPVSMLAILVDRRKKACHFYIGGRDESFRGPPSGLILHAHAIRYAISSGFTRYDFLRGNEPYKYSFATGEARITSLVLSTRSGENLGGRLDPRCLDYVRRRSAALYRERSFSAARRGFEQVLEVRPHDRGVLYLHGMVSARLGDHATAVRRFRSLLGHDPGGIRVLFRLGRSQIGLRDWAGAADTHCRLLAHNPGFATAWYRLGRILLILGQTDPALAAFEAALRLKPGHAAARTAMARTLLLRRKRVPGPAGRHADVGRRARILAGRLAAAGAAQAGPRSFAADLRNWQKTDSALLTVLAASRAGEAPLAGGPARR